MTIWIGLVVIAQLINAAIVLVDKYLLNTDRGIGRPAIYAFYISMLSLVVLVMVPFGVVSWPSALVVGLSLATAVSYIFSIFFLYSALKTMDASDAAPVVGAISAIVTFILARVWLNQDLPQTFTLGFTLLVIGTLLISHFRFNTRSFALVFFSGALFGLSAFLVKLIFLNASFADGFFWSRIANVVVAASMLILPSNWKLIKESFHGSSSGIKWLLVGNKTLSGIAFVLILFAISVGSVSIVNALSGLQFVFLLTFAYFCAGMFPAVFKGEIHPHKIHHKLYGIIFIIFGFVSLFLQ
ncbi:MAG: DMT family transporter [Patescibacteria group bacterium]